MAGICIYMVDVHPPCSQATSVVVSVSRNFSLIFLAWFSDRLEDEATTVFVYTPLLLFVGYQSVC